MTGLDFNFKYVGFFFVPRVVSIDFRKKLAAEFIETNYFKFV